MAREIVEAALPLFHSPLSKHTFTQPTLLAIQCLMRHEDWTYRGSRKRGAPGQACLATCGVGISRGPDDTTPCRCLHRTTEEDLARLLHEAIRQLPRLEMEGQLWRSMRRGLRPAPYVADERLDHVPLLFRQIHGGSLLLSNTAYHPFLR